MPKQKYELTAEERLLMLSAAVALLVLNFGVFPFATRVASKSIGYLPASLLLLGLQILSSLVFINVYRGWHREWIAGKDEKLREAQWMQEVEVNQRNREVVLRMINRCRPICELHKISLAIEKKRLTSRNIYGGLVAEEWNTGPEGVSSFIGTVIIPEVGIYNWNHALACSEANNRKPDLTAEITLLINSAADSVRELPGGPSA